jgi:hypothetical protein
MRLPRFAFTPSTARVARGVSLHAGPSAPEAKGGRPPALVGDSLGGVRQFSVRERQPASVGVVTVIGTVGKGRSDVWPSGLAAS